MIRLVSLIICLLCTCSAYAGVRITDTSPGNNLRFNNWSGSGDRTVDLNFCAVSVNGGVRRSVTPVPYQIRVRTTGRGRANTPLQLEASSGSGDILPLRVSYTDLTSNSTEQLQANIYTAQNKQGEINNCPAGANARLRFSINQADLASVAAGTYQTRVRVLIRGGNNGTQVARRNIRLTIILDDIVSIQGLNDILLGSYSGSGDLSATEAFCIARNGSGTYQVTASGNGPGGSFALLNNSNTLPFTARWDDGSSISDLIANSSLTTRQNAYTSANQCGTTTPNANLLITIAETDLANSPSGNYRGTLTLIIAPE